MIELTPWTLVGLVALGYLLVGICAFLGGFFAGERAERRGLTPAPKEKPDIHSKAKQEAEQTKEKTADEKSPTAKEVAEDVNEQTDSGGT